VDSLAAIRSDRVVAVVRAERVADPALLAQTLAAAGIRAIEFTFTIPSVLEAIEAAAETEAVVGAGTVLTESQARDAIAAGARFVVSPACVPGLAEPCRTAGVPLFLGALSPTEVYRAVTAGATAVKLFPAALGGPEYLRHLRGPFPNIDFLPSGGIDEQNASAFLDAGALAVYAGSSLAPPELVAAGEHSEIARRARSFVASLS
jgi:2-dehydro-3-deoxyphosphogluconate aldolase / (4S)-4-hydroxy-2-oxoglutarate aldolase